MKSVSTFGVGLLAGAIIAWAAGNGCGPDLSRIEASRDSLRTAVTALRDSQTVRAQRDSATTASLVNRVAQRGQSVSRIVVMTDTVLGNAVEMLPPSTGDFLIQQIAAERAEWQGAVAVRDTLIAALTAQVSYWRDTALVQTRGQLDRAQSLLDSALVARRPSRFWRGVGVGAAVVGAVVLLR